MFIATYDARVTRASQAGSRVSIRLSNIGKRNDSYQLSLDPESAGSISKSDLTIPEGASVLVTVQLERNAVLRVVSLGRGDEVAATQLSLR